MKAVILRATGVLSAYVPLEDYSTPGAYTVPTGYNLVISKITDKSTSTSTIEMQTPNLGEFECAMNPNSAHTNVGAGTGIIIPAGETMDVKYFNAGINPGNIVLFGELVPQT